MLMVLSMDGLTEIPNYSKFELNSTRDMDEKKIQFIKQNGG